MKFRTLATALLGLLAVLAASLPAQAYAYQRLADGTPRHWDLDETGTQLSVLQDGVVLITLDPDGSADITDGSDLRAINAAMKEISQADGSRFRYELSAFSTTHSVAVDNANRVFWLEDTTVVDGQDIAGALGVCFNFAFTSGPEIGETVEIDVVFNGNQFTWTTDPLNNPTLIDIKSVGIHELGHGTGLDHSALGAATMYPRTGAGTFAVATLSDDDRAGLRDQYSSSTRFGTLAGQVTKSSVGVLGAHVVAVDAEDGEPVAGAFSDTNGNYEINGLGDGDYFVYAEPLDDPAGTSSLFTQQNLGGTFYDAADLNFLTSADSGNLVVQPNTTTTQDIAVTNGTPALNITRVGTPLGVGNSPTALRRGVTTTVIVSGPGLPNSGTPLNVSGEDFTIHGTGFTTVGGDPAVAISITFDVDAITGPRSLIVTSGGERTIASGFLEVLDPPRANSDFDGDGASDPGLFRGDTGRWYLRWGLETGNPLGGFDAQFQYGGPGDWALAGDWNGDQRTDVGIYRSSEAAFYLLTERSDNAPIDDFQIRNFGGGLNDVPIVGDWDGDGRDSIGIFRLDTGEWYLAEYDDYNGIEPAVVFGGSETFTDVPVPGDYSGDGITDIAIYRLTTGEWFVDTNFDGLADFHWVYGGHPLDRPLVGDFNGDGSDDPALFRSDDPNFPGSSRWFMGIERTDTAITGDYKILDFGDADDYFLQGDFNGDGLADPAVWDVGTGEFKWVTSRELETLTGGLTNNAILGTDSVIYGGDASDQPTTLPTF